VDDKVPDSLHSIPVRQSRLNSVDDKVPVSLRSIPVRQSRLTSVDDKVPVSLRSIPVRPGLPDIFYSPHEGRAQAVIAHVDLRWKQGVCVFIINNNLLCHGPHKVKLQAVIAHIDLRGAQGHVCEFNNL
jgi:hypothetical protein